MAERYVGWTEAAEALDAAFPGHGRTLNRKQVYMWWRRRAANGFPERMAVEVEYATRPPRVLQLLDIEQVTAWFRGYTTSDTVSQGKLAEPVDNL